LSNPVILVLEQNSLESELNAATTIGEFFLQSLSDSPKGLEKRNASGDGRQPIYELPFEEPTPLFSTGKYIGFLGIVTKCFR
jgi:hypothetical protein